jgi:hypothetical protein
MSSMRKQISITLIFTIVHAGVCLVMLPWANVGFQRSFDTGLPATVAERFAYLLGLVLSFPFAFWSLWLHAANINQVLFILSVIANSLLWGVCVYRLIGRQYRRAGIQQSI